ncbi:sucrose-6-phosphate hydrolase [Niallia sp. FSL W8-0635]|uniref:sucrose-6-phosphate hydrolase n=1 Tax=Niallia sp. FSL W8-0635 TaxID=2975337 RepID=UPI0009D20DCC|nr:Sucrose-6-phosphate hydrolase [Mycobacteroides abscessus subsp. abscessus]HEO8420311.1 sucrose-6-phosphate hydrolase [Yersinia enterocolitica]
MTETLMQKAYNEVKKYRNKVINDPYRLRYHLMAPVGLLNDPNGLIQFKGVYHVFYQWNPFETTHGAKFWGHYTSEDMVHWREDPIALAPSEWYDRNGCYSGSAVESNGKLYLFYTGNVKQEDGTRETYQCLAVSENGIDFEKLGPVLRLPEHYTSHFRDPKVWKKDDLWYMVVGAQTLEEKGTVALFHSKDLYHWEEAGRIAGSEMDGLKDFGYMWECPDLIHLNGKDVLLVSPQGLKPDGDFFQNLFQSGYFIGELDYKRMKFQHGAFAELDRGFDFYAPQTFRDESGRTILYGWMGITDELEAYQPTIVNRWVHALTIPRELELHDGKIFQKPVKELKKLRKNKVVVETNKFEAISAELSIDFEKVGPFKISFRNEAYLSFESDRLTLERRNLKSGNLESRTCKIASVSKLQIFMDHSSLEIFINEGEEIFTARYFPNLNDAMISIEGEAKIKVIKWNLGNDGE